MNPNRKRFHAPDRPRKGDGTSTGRLERRLGLVDAVVVGLGAMVGAGIFAALGPAADAAGTGAGLLAGLALAAVVAWCNATSSARLAARYPASGGTYVYGRQRLGAFWGYLAGWAFVTGKTASCAAIALTLGAYLWPAQAHLAAVLAVLAVTGVNLAGVQKSARLAAVVVAVVLAVLAALVVAVGVHLATGQDGVSQVWRTPGPAVGAAGAGVGGVLSAAGLLFFAFAGYARVATLGEEVRDPRRTIPRAIGLALVGALAVYTAVAIAALAVLGADGLATAPAPLSAVAAATDAAWLEPAVLVAAAVATLGSLLSLTLGVSRTSLAMARDRFLPHALSAVSRGGVPRRAEVAVGVLVAAAAAVADLRHVIGFSSFAVLLYYAIANASAWTLSPAGARLLGSLSSRLVPVGGMAGCLLLAFSLPARSVWLGAAVTALGALLYPALRATRNRDAARSRR